MQEKLCSIEDVAKAYSVEEATVRLWCRKGLLEGAIHAGRTWRIPSKYAEGNIEIKITKKDATQENDA